MKKRTSKKKDRFTWEKFATIIANPTVALVMLALTFLIAIRTNHDNVSNTLLVVLFAFVMIAYFKTKVPIPNSDVGSHEEKTSFSVGGDSGISMNHEEKTTKQDKN